MKQAARSEVAPQASRAEQRGHLPTCPLPPTPQSLAPASNEHGPAASTSAGNPHHTVSAATPLPRSAAAPAGLRHHQRPVLPAAAAVVVLVAVPGIQSS